MATRSPPTPPPRLTGNDREDIAILWEWISAFYTSIARENNLLASYGSMALQDADAVAITGGTEAGVSITGGTVSGLDAPIAVGDGGTGATTPAAARANLGAAPNDAAYLVSVLSGELSAERVPTDTISVTWSFGTPGQAQASVVGEFIDDRVAALLVAGTNITLTYSDVGNTLTIDATPGGAAPDTIDYLVRTATGSLSAERVVTDTASITWDWATAGQAKAGIAVTYAGQTSITTLGTIGTGTWQGSVVAGQYGGTGVANTGKTITLGGSILTNGNLSTSGGFGINFALTGDSNFTVPLTGTLATLAGTETLSNKTLRASDGTLGAPSISFGSDTNTGFWWTGLFGDQIQVSAGGILSLTIYYDQLLHADGLVGTPGISWLNDADTGIYRISANTMGIAAAGARIAAVNTVGLGLGASATPTTEFLRIAPSTTAKAQIAFESGVAPTSPNSGDWWWDGTNLRFRQGATSQVIATTSNKLSDFAATTSLELKGTISDETGSGALVFATSPALTTPDLGTPTAVTLTSATGLPVATGISGLGANVATFLATPSSANLAAAVTDETGSGALVFGTAPTIVGGTHTAITGLGIRSTGSGAFDLTVVNTENLTAGRALTVKLNDAARSIDLSGSIQLAGNLSTSGGFGINLAATGSSNFTVPLSGTLATTSNKLSDFAATTSLELKGNISDETGSGALVFANTPTLVTPVLGLATGTSIALSGNLGIAGAALPTKYDVVTNSGALHGGKIGTVSMGAASGDFARVGYNFCTTAAGTKYQYDASDTASAIEFTNGGFTFYTAGSGTAANDITFASRAVLTASALTVDLPITANNATSIPAGGTAGAGLKVSSTANFGVFFGSGAPTLSAAKGSLYLRSDGTTTNDRAYINTNGSTTWTALTTAA